MLCEEEKRKYFRRRFSSKVTLYIFFIKNAITITIDRISHLKTKCIHITYRMIFAEIIITLSCIYGFNLLTSIDGPCIERHDSIPSPSSPSLHRKGLSSISLGLEDKIENREYNNDF